MEWWATVLREESQCSHRSFLDVGLASSMPWVMDCKVKSECLEAIETKQLVHWEGFIELIALQVLIVNSLEFEVTIHKGANTIIEARIVNDWRWSKAIWTMNHAQGVENV
jgi:hypothetical protein